MVFFIADIWAKVWLAGAGVAEINSPVTFSIPPAANDTISVSG